MHAQMAETRPFFSSSGLGTRLIFNDTAGLELNRIPVLYIYV